jgi:methylthioribose-1-phosphate isomerase
MKKKTMSKTGKKQQFSPLFWPITLDGTTISILDETLLPHKVKYIKAHTYQEAARAIKDMKTRAVGQVILVMYTFLLVLRKNRSQKNIVSLLEKVAKVLNSTRPTLSFKFLTDMVLGWAAKGVPLEKSIEGFLKSLKNIRLAQARRMAGFLNHGDVILTHCNISGLLPLIADICKRDKKKISFFVTETRPYLQGSRLTAWELDRSGYEVVVICDNMVAQVMYEAKVNKVVVGADNMAQNGDFANKIGTYQIALLAKHFKIPFYVICPPASSARDGDDIPIELRPEKELLTFGGKSIAPSGVRAYYPAFDITPKNLITKHIYFGE